MSEPRLCCNCLHCARWKKKDGIECHCDLDDRYLGYLTVMDEENDCKCWEKETKWDLEREHDKQIRADAIDEYKQELKQDINCRLKSVEKYLEGETLDAWRQATRTFKDAIDYFAKQLKEQKK